MGLSHLKGNSGFLGIDKRSQIPSKAGVYSASTEAGTMSVKKHFLERNGGILKPFCTSNNPTKISQGKLHTENWENFVAGEWSTTIDGDMRWAIVGTVGVGGGTAAVCFNTNLSSYTYVANTDIHLWVDVYVPPNTRNMTLDFDWKCNGETVGATSYDYGYVWITNTGDTPTSVARESAADLAKRLGGDSTESSSAVYYRKYNTDYVAYAGQWNTEPTIYLNSGATQSGGGEVGSPGTFVPNDLNRFVFSFTSDGSDQNDPPFGVDNLVWRWSGDTSYCIDNTRADTLSNTYQPQVNGR
jgi:hypothetical protein